MKNYEEIMKYNRQAIESLGNLNCDGTLDNNKLVQDSIIYHKLILEACEKQIPKSFGCEVCRDTSNSRYYDNLQYIYCPHCGQKREMEVTK